MPKAPAIIYYTDNRQRRQTSVNYVLTQDDTGFKRATIV